MSYLLLVIFSKRDGDGVDAGSGAGEAKGAKSLGTSPSPAAMS